MTGFWIALAVVVATSPAVASDAGAPVAPGGWQPLVTGARQDNTRALELLRAGELEKAEALFGQAFRKDPTDAEIANNWGSVLARLSRHDDAEDAYRAALALVPERHLAWCGLADLYASDPTRWQRREALAAVLAEGLTRLPPGSRGRTNLMLRVANFERSVGMLAEARRRLSLVAATGALDPEQHRRLRDLRTAIDRDEDVRSMEDWPAPQVAASAREGLSRAEEHLAARDAARALAELTPIIVAHPDWPEARWLRARVASALGQHDEATADLSVVVRLAPSFTQAWRLLAETLVEHGGRSDMEQAETALGRALALEPSSAHAPYLWRFRADVALRLGKPMEAGAALDRCRALDPENATSAEVARLARRIADAQSRAGGGPAGEPARGSLAPPSDEVRRRFEEARAWMAAHDPADMAPRLLDEVLAVAPGFVEAALARYTLSEQIAHTTVEAVWSAPDDLWTLTSGVLEIARGARGAEPDDGADPVGGAQDARERIGAARNLVAPWLDRLVALGHAEALVERALVRQAQGDRAGALQDLRMYVARDPDAARVAEANDLRAALVNATPSDEARTRVLLAEGKDDVAAAHLGGRCGPSVPAGRLLLLADVFLFQGRLPDAADCYRAVLTSAKAEPVIRARAGTALATLAVRAPVALRRHLVPVLQTITGVPAADLALARAAEDAERPTSVVLAHVDAYLRGAGSDEAPDVKTRALVMRQRLTTRVDASQRRRDMTAAVGGGVGLLALGLLGFLRVRGHSLAGAVTVKPGLFPEVAEAVGRIRHDVIKHRAGALSALQGEPPPVHVYETLATSLLEPVPASRLTLDIHAGLVPAARGHGLVLRPATRDRVLGPLLRDLRRAEACLSEPSPAKRHQQLRRIDARIRQTHAGRLASLMSMGPVTRVNSTLLASWVRTCRAEQVAAESARDNHWITPGLEVEGEDLRFAVEERTLHAIFNNLLRNAQQAPRDAHPDDPSGTKIVVRAATSRDAVGRRVVILAVVDAAPATVTLDDIEARDADRGLGIVRELVRKWRGQIVITPESTPLRKSIAVHFPAEDHE